MRTSVKAIMSRVIHASSWFIIALLIFLLIASVAGIMIAPNVSGAIFLGIVAANLLLVLIASLYIGKKLIEVFLKQKNTLIGAKLHVRLVGIFSTLAFMPTLVVSVASIFVLNQGLETWFSDRVTRALDGSLEVAQSYLREQQKTLLLENKSILSTRPVADAILLLDERGLRESLEQEKLSRLMSEVYVFQTDGTLFGGPSAGDVILPTAVLSAIRQPVPGGETHLSFQNNRIYAVSPIGTRKVLVSARLIEPILVARMNETEETYRDYYELRSRRSAVQFTLTLVMGALALVALASAIWVGLTLARKIITPVTDLVFATNKVSAGELDVRLVPQDDDEIGILTQSFNRMTGQLRQNRELLEKKNKELDERRRGMEAVLTGVTSAVVALDNTGTVILSNRIADENFGLKQGECLSNHSAELYDVFEEFIDKLPEIEERKISIYMNGEERRMLLRMVPMRQSRAKTQAVVMTVDDISDLLSAQKVAAWADVAQRLAHEIKNPLTPIQVSAERLKRKYTKIMPEDDRELFGQLTGTIVGRVEDLREMLNEFSDFARMPAAKQEVSDIIPLIKEEVLLQQQGRENIAYEKNISVEHAEIDMDKSHIRRALTNLLENAANAVSEHPDAKNRVGLIKLVVDMSQSGRLLLSIEDNGVGIAEDVDLDKLFDPYVTTRKKGTGLGLAIVRRVMDQHGGQIKLCRREEGGTKVELSLPTIHT